MYSDIIFWISYLVVIIIILIFGYSLILSFYNKVPFIPSKKTFIQKMVQITKINKSDKVADLGCGNMKILIHLEKTTRVYGTGFEISPLPYFLGRINLILNGSKSQILLKNFFNTDLSAYNIIFIYLTPPILRKLEQKIIKECKPGTKIISNTFSLPNLNPKKTVNIKPGQNIYLYEI